MTPIDPPREPLIVPRRFQLSLFVPAGAATKVEAVRRILDPVQSRLIPAHVTLCREDELSAHRLEDLASRLGEPPHGHLTLRFGAPERFHEHGMLLPCLCGAPDFDALRQFILAPRLVRPHAPHLTLAHPRNPRAPGNELGSAASLRDGLSVTFADIQLIQQDGDAPWVVSRTFPLPTTTT